MTAVHDSFTLRQGQDATLTVTVTDTAGDAVDLTGASVRFVMGRNYTDSFAVDSNASPQSATATVSNGSGGIITVLISDTVMDDLIGDYLYEVKVTDASGNESVVTEGTITVKDTLI